MADNSTLASTTGGTGLADSSILIRKLSKTSKENLCIRSASCVEGKHVICFKMPNHSFNPKLTD